MVNGRYLPGEFQTLFNTLQNFRNQLKILDVRPFSHYTYSHLPASIHIDPSQNITQSLLQSKVLKGDSLRRLRRYVVIIGTHSQFSTQNEAIQQILLSVKCKDFVVCQNFSSFLQEYSFLTTRESEYPNQIIRGSLYLGNQGHAADWKVIQNLKITHVVNVTNSAPNFFQKEGIVYLKLPILDKDSENIHYCFRVSWQFIERAIQEGGRVLVHCAQGVSRSVTIVVMYLMNVLDISAKKAIKYIKTLRREADPNEGFKEKLESFGMGGNQFIRSQSSSKFRAL